ncbi:MAG: acetylxylan esterase [Bryobacteraceae bacterium]|nr:acetylxylan esterase [Bryobacteraceae bacterium]
MKRRCLLLLLTALAPMRAQDAASRAWLVDREDLIPNTPALIKSLSEAAEYVLRWKLPADAEAWRGRRPEAERAFRRAIGLERLPERTPLNARITSTLDRGDYLVQNVIFESRPGFPVTANLYRSKSRAQGKRPAVVSPIGHYLGAGKTAADIQARCIKLARMGFVVLVYDAIGQGERMIPGNIHHEAGYALLPLGETIAGWMVWDSMRAVDYVLTLPDVDPERIGITGNSGGGLNTLFTAALEQRAKAAVVVGYTFEFNNWLKYAGAHCTCTHLPGLFRAMEWFEVAGLIAPRALMMLQGEHDGIFPIGGARRAGRNTEAVYALLGLADRARFVELPGLPHAYSRLYRERMYGWLAKHLMGEGTGEPIAEGDVDPLPEKDPRLLCDPEGAVIPRSPSVVELARKRAVEALAKLPSGSVAGWVRELTAPPEPRPHYLSPDRGKPAPVAGGTLETLSFLSEDGGYVPGMLWLPERPSSPSRTVLIVDSRGKAEVAKSGLVEPLLRAGYAVFAIDLRGRGETLGYYRPTWNTNFRLVANQTLFGQPLAGRRAFDLLRAIDFLALRKDPGLDNLSVVGVGDDALPALLAAAADARIRRVAMAGWFHSFVSPMQPMGPRKMPDSWNDAQLEGGLNNGKYKIDFGSVIPRALEHADVAGIAALVAPRPLLFCQALDHGEPAAEPLAAGFRRVTESAGKGWIAYEPGAVLDAARLTRWLSATQ